MTRVMPAYRPRTALALLLFAAMAIVTAACAADPTATPTPSPTATPTEQPAATATPEPTPPSEAQTIVDIAANDDRFETLITSVTTAGLADTLSGEGPFTVFAPTDDAFDALPEGTVEGLLADIPALADVLLYHVVDGEVTAEQVMGLDSAETLLGEPVAIEIKDGNVFVNDAQVVVTDVQASNGIIHVIDAVLLPPSA